MSYTSKVTWQDFKFPDAIECLIVDFMYIEVGVHHPSIPQAFLSMHRQCNAMCSNYECHWNADVSACTTSYSQISLWVICTYCLAPIENNGNKTKQKSENIRVHIFPFRAISTVLRQDETILTEMMTKCYSEFRKINILYSRNVTLYLLNAW